MFCEAELACCGAVRGKPTLTLAAFEARLSTFFLEVYQPRACAETKMSPAARREANGFLPRLPDSLEQLLIQVAKGRQVDGGRHLFA
jgi:putative transposase